MIRFACSVFMALSLVGAALAQAPQPGAPPARPPQSRAEIGLSFAPVVKRAARTIKTAVAFGMLEYKLTDEVIHGAK